MQNECSYNEFNINFKEVHYIVILKASDTEFQLILESSEPCYWRGSFNKEAISNLTTKVKSYKDYIVFLKMLYTGLNSISTGSECNSLVLELFDQVSIEEMRSKKKMNESMDSSFKKSQTSSMTHTKLKNLKNMYLVLTMYNEFERNSYPLVLEYLVAPEQTLLMNTICRIKSNSAPQPIKKQEESISMLQSNNNSSSVLFENEAMKNEIFALKKKMQLLENQRSPGAAESEEILYNYTKIKEEYESYVKLSEKKMRDLINLTNDLKHKVDQQNEESSNNKSNEIGQSKLIELEKKNEDLSKVIIEERQKVKSLVEKKNAELESISKELLLLRENEKKMKVKINQLEKELDRANSRNNYISKVNSTPKSNKSNYSVKSGYSKGSQISKGSFSSNFSKNSNSSAVKKGLAPSNIKKPFVTKLNPLPKSTSKSKLKSFNTFSNIPPYLYNTKGTKSVKSNTSNSSNNHIKKNTNLNASPVLSSRKNQIGKQNKPLQNNNQKTKVTTTAKDKPIIKSQVTPTNSYGNDNNSKKIGNDLNDLKQRLNNLGSFIGQSKNK